jgi:tetratricopeptide (TPR) repeat protein
VSRKRPTAGYPTLLVLLLVCTSAGFYVGHSWFVAGQRRAEISSATTNPAERIEMPSTDGARERRQVRARTPAISHAGLEATRVAATASATELHAASDLPSLRLAGATELLDRGRESLVAGNVAGGLEAFESAVELHPSAEAHGALGGLYFMMSVRSKAHSHLERAAELDPDSPDRWIALANAHQLRADRDGSLQALRRARELEPTLAVVRDVNGYLYRPQAGSDSVFYQSPYLPKQGSRLAEGAHATSQPE